MSWYQQNTGLRPQQMPLPAGWEAKYDPNSRRWFYLNHATKTTQWDDPRLTMQMGTRQPQGQQYGQQTQKAKAETSFMQINADDTKVKYLTENYGIDEDLAKSVLQKHINILSSTETELKTMGYKKNEKQTQSAQAANNLLKIDPDDTKVKYLMENYGIDEDLAKSMLRTHINILSSTETALKTMGYKKVEKFMVNESYVDHLHKDYETAEKDLIRSLLRTHQNKYSATETALKSMGYKKVESFVLNQHFVDQIHDDFPSATKTLIGYILRRNNNDFMKTVSSLQSQGHAKKIVADELLVTQLKSVYKDATPDVIRSVLVQVDNNVGRFRTEIQKMGFVKGGKKVNKSKPAKKEPTQAEKNKMKRDMKTKYPHADDKTIEMCLNTTNYNISITEILLKKEKKESSKPKSFEMPSDDLYKSTSQAPVVFGEETEFPAIPEIQLFDMSKLSSSTRPSIISMLNRPQAPKVKKPTLTPQKQTARQKKVSTVQQKNYQARNVNWKTSENRMKPTGPDPSLRKGPEPSLLITEYVAAMGPNKDIRNGSQAANRCGPLPSNRNGPGNLAVGPMNCVF